MELAALGVDVSHVHVEGPADNTGSTRSAQLVLDEDEFQSLLRSGWKAQLVVDDLQSYYAARLQEEGSIPVAGAAYGDWLSPPFAQGSVSGYYNTSEIGSVLDQIHNAYPMITGPKTSIGQTVEGREIWVIKVSDNPLLDEAEPEVRIDAMHHAREPQSMQTSLWFLLWLVEQYGNDPLATYLVNEREIYILPCVNPDGYAFNLQNFPQGGGLWRKNRRNNGGGSFGVDLNRNYPFKWGFDNAGSSPNPNSDLYRGPGAASEPEVRAMATFIAKRDFKTVLSMHSYSDLWLSPLWYVEAAPANQAQYDEVAALATEFNGFPNGPASILLYRANGTTLDYDHGVHGSLAWTPELGRTSDGFWPPASRIVPIAENSRIAIARTALAAGPYIHVGSVDVVEVLGDGDGNFEGGEVFELDVEVRNSGLAAANQVQLQVISASAQLEVQNGLEVVGVLAPFSTGGPANAPRLRIIPGTPPGRYGYEILVGDGVLQQGFAGEIQVGVSSVLQAFDFEAAGNQGWQVGAPNDASSGTWTRDDPRGTPAQPEDDHTPGAGNTTCWFTGQGSVGGNQGENDVDGGTTSLLSPIFDLAGHSAVNLTYWLWYSTTPNEDILEVDLSNDGGVQWTTVEVVGPIGLETSGGWQQRSLALDGDLPLTAQMRVRWRASDLNGASIVEAAIDDVVLSTLGEGGCPSPQTYCNTTPNTVGPGVFIGTTGSTGVSDGNFSLHANGIPAGNFGLFFYGPGQGAVPLGEGTLCLTAPFTRFAPLQANALGEVSLALPLGGALSAGTSWNFQFWYRDPSGGPLGFNLSDAVEVVFCN